MTSDVARYEASISAAPYAGRVIAHLVKYLEDSLSAGVDAHSIPLGVTNVVSAGPDYDMITVHNRFYAASQIEASAVTHAAAEKVGPTDEHWKVVGEPSVVRAWARRLSSPARAGSRLDVVGSRHDRGPNAGPAGG